MPSTTGTSKSKSKKGFRGFIRDTFGRSSSHSQTASTSSQRPVAQTLFPAGAPNEFQTRHTPSSVDIPPSTDGRSTTSHVMTPSTVGTEHVDSQPTPPATDVPAAQDVSEVSSLISEQPAPSQSVSATTEISVESAQPPDSRRDSQSNLLATETPGPTTLDPPDTTPAIINVAWDGLRSSLQDLKDNSGLFPPLASAADTLLGCFDELEASTRNQQGHEELARELATQGSSLTQCLSTSTSIIMSKGVSSVAFGIKQQAQEIKGKLDCRTEEKPALAKEDDVEVMKHLQQILVLFGQLQINLSMNSWGIANEHLVNTRLEGLKPAKEATYNSTLSSAVNRRTCTTGTRTEVIANLVEWVHDREASPIYWMHGTAGTGKTTIAHTFSEWLEHEELLAASFFYTHATANCRDMTRMIPTIAYQLARYSIPFQSELYEILDNEPDAGSKNIQNQLERLLRDPLLKVKDSLPDHLVVVIDALDECDDHDGIQRMLDMFCLYAPQVPLKFFVTSRPEPGVYSNLSSQQGSQKAIHLHDIEKSPIQVDIESYLRSELSFVSPSRAEIEVLAQRAGPLFIYVTTLVRYIQAGKRLADPNKRLKSVLSMIPEATRQHAQIDALYTVVLESALNENEPGADGTKDIRVVMRTVLFAQEPISMETITTLAGMDDLKRVRSALEPLRPVLHHSEETGLISILHASFRDFMFDNERSGAHSCRTVEYNRMLAERCFIAMEEQLRFNMCNLESSFIPDDKVNNIQRRIQEGILPDLTYACRHWASHLALAFKSDTLLAMLTEFIRCRLLFWMEVLNLRREIDMGVAGLLKVKQWLNQAGSTSYELMVLVEDARNFVTDFAGSPASQSTPHIYISLLPFCSRSSSIFKHYWKRMQGLLELHGSFMEHKETMALATWYIGSEVYSVASSPDGTQVAVGCEKGGTRVLDAHDGTQLLCLSQDDNHGANSVAYSPDGKSLASGHGGKDCSIRLWDARNGALIAHPHNCASDVHCVSFSPDSMRVAFGSYGKDVYVWNARDSTLFQSPINHFYQVFSIAFSPDGALVASSSSISTKGTIHLWNPHDGAPTTSPLQGHTGHVMSLAFTPDGTRLVSGSEDKTIRIWNALDGSPVGNPFKGHTQGIRSVAVSPNGTRVASGSNDRTVRVWNIDDGTLVAGPFIGHAARVCSVTYSPDGTRVISGSSDHSIRVWSVRDGLLSPPVPFKRHMSHLKSISFFGNGFQILSASEDSSFWVWNTPPCKATSSSSERERISSLKQSLPTTRANVAVIPEDHTQQILGTVDGYPLSGSLRGHKDPLTSSTISANNTFLITGFGNGLIRIWDLQKAELVVGPFHGHGGEVTSLLLSPDNSHIISCSREDITIRVWDTRNTILRIAPLASSPTGSTPTQGDPHLLDGWNIREDGWVTNSSSHLLFWIPGDFSSSHVWPSPHAEFIVTKNGVLHIPPQELILGQQWSRCYLSN